MVTTRPYASVLGGVACLLAGTAMAPLFAGTRWWFQPMLIAVTVAVTTAVLGRLLGRTIGRPGLYGFCLSLNGLAVTLTAVCATETALLGVIPTPSTVRTLSDLVRPTASEIRELAVPVPERPGLVVLIIAAIYLVAMAVDLLVVVADRPALAGLPLLAIFLVPAAILPAGVGTLPFLLGATGFIALMLLDGSRAVSRWGRQMGDHPPNLITNGLGPVGMQIAAGCLALAAAVPLLLPSLDGRGVVDSGNGLGSGEGRSSASVIQPIVSLSQQIHDKREIPLLRVTTTTPRYLRLTALENFDGQRFTLRALNATKDARVSEGLPGPETDVRVVPTVATVAVSKEMTERYLPVPGIPTRFEGLQGDWRLASPTGTVFSTRTSTSGLRYTVHAAQPEPTSAQISGARGPVPASMGVVTRLPASLDPRLAGLLARVTAGADSNYAKVVAVQNHLRGPDFTYDLTGAPTVHDGALANFLFESRRGYCEQFASAMAVLVRMLGLPSRVAIGFTHGTLQADGTWVVTNKQAHAWPEVWFPELGWIPFEPTRRADGTTPAPDYAPSSDPGGTTDLPPLPQTEDQTGVEPVPLATPVPAEPEAAGQELPGAEPAAEEDRGDSFPPSWLPWFGLALAILAVLSVPGLLRLALRRSRMTPAAQGRPRSGGERDAAVVAQVHAAWAELVDVAADLGIRLRRSDSPRSGAQRLIAYLEAGPEAGSDEVAAASDALIRLATAQERARYAPPGTLTTDYGLLADLTLVRKVLLSVAPRGRRTMAALAPPSVLQRVTDLNLRDTVGRLRRDHDGDRRPPAAKAPPEQRTREDAMTP